MDIAAYLGPELDQALARVAQPYDGVYLVGGTVRAFPARETAVLEILLRRSGNVAPKRLFEDHLFGLSGDVGSNAVEVYVHRLRKMLADSGATVKIHTVRGVGYKFVAEK